MLATARRLSSIEVTSPAIASTESPNSAFSRSLLSFERSSTPSLAPSSMKRATIARPSPDAPPVTSATLPSSQPICCFSLFRAFRDDAPLEKETQISREYRRLIEDDLPPRDLPSQRRGDAAQQIVPHTRENFDFALETRPIEQVIAVDLEFIGVRRAAHDDIADQMAR